MKPYESEYAYFIGLVGVVHILAAIALFISGWRDRTFVVKTFCISVGLAATNIGICSILFATFALCKIIITDNNKELIGLILLAAISASSYSTAIYYLKNRSEDK